MHIWKSVKFNDDQIACNHLYCFRKRSTTFQKYELLGFSMLIEAPRIRIVAITTVSAYNLFAAATLTASSPESPCDPRGSSFDRYGSDLIWLISGGNGFSLALELVPHGGAKCAEATSPLHAISSKMLESFSLVRSNVWIATPDCRFDTESMACTASPALRTDSERFPEPANTSAKTSSSESPSRSKGARLCSETGSLKSKPHKLMQSMSGYCSPDFCTAFAEDETSTPLELLLDSGSLSVAGSRLKESTGLASCCHSLLSLLQSG